MSRVLIYGVSEVQVRVSKQGKVLIQSSIQISQIITQFASKYKNKKIMDCDAKWDEEPVGRKYNQNYTSIYPSENIKNRHFTNCDQIFRALHQEALEIGYYKQQTFIKVQMKVEGINQFIFKCRKNRCKAILRFKRMGSSLVLQHFHNIHSHRYLLYLRRARTQKIMKYLSSLPAQDCVQFYNNALQNKFNLTKRIARYFSRKVFWTFTQIDQLFIRLQELNAKFRRDTDSKILVVCSQTMRKNYIIYGDLISFDITYKLVKRSKKIKHLGVGFVVGEDQNKRIVMFGICATHDETTQNFKTIFTYFFQCNDDLIPKTILTDDQRALVLAIESLKQQRKYNYTHMLDWYHKMENLKKRLTKAANRDILFALYVRLLKQVSDQVFLDIVKQIIQFSDDSELLEEFLKEENRYCMSKVDCSFFGLGISSTRSQSLNNLIKRAVPNQTSTQNMVFIVFRVELRLLRNMGLWHRVNPQLLNHIKDKCVCALSNDLEIKLFDQIFEVYWLSRQSFQLEQIDSITYKINYEKYDRPYFFVLKYDIGAACWRCSCKGIFKSGLPCAHIGHLLIKFGGCLGYYINERWLHAKHKAQRMKFSYPKISYSTSRFRRMYPQAFKKDPQFNQW